MYFWDRIGPFTEGMRERALLLEGLAQHPAVRLTFNISQASYVFFLRAHCTLHLPPSEAVVRSSKLVVVDYSDCLGTLQPLLQRGCIYFKRSVVEKERGKFRRFVPGLLRSPTAERGLPSPWRRGTLDCVTLSTMVARREHVS